MLQGLGRVAEALDEADKRLSETTFKVVEILRTNVADSAFSVPEGFSEVTDTEAFKVKTAPPHGGGHDWD